MTNLLDNVNVSSQEVLITPEQLKADIPLTEQSLKTITDAVSYTHLTLPTKA